MKKVVMLFFVMNSYLLLSQVSSETEFLRFSKLSPKEQYSMLVENNWNVDNYDNSALDNKIVETQHFSKNINGVFYMLKIQSSTYTNYTTSNITSVYISEFKTYEKWVLNMKKKGVVFKKDLAKGGDTSNYNNCFIFLKKMNGDKGPFMVSIGVTNSF